MFSVRFVLASIKGPAYGVSSSRSKEVCQIVFLSLSLCFHILHSREEQV